jgi:sigma-E factor negative regulatory protein RseA
MTADEEELLSALVDGELEGEALDQAITLLSTNEAARERFQRYQLTSNVLNGHAIGHRQRDITQLISTAIAEEPVHSISSVQTNETIITPTESPKAEVLTFPERFWKQTVGLAVAASFGALAVVGTMTQPEYSVMPASPTASLAAASESKPTVEVAIQALQEPSNRWTVTEQEVADRLNVYLVDHNEYAGASDIFSNARVIAYESGQ